MKLLAVATFALLTTVLPAFAADAVKEDTKPAEQKAEETASATPAENPGRYAPEFCDFEITFPEAPHKAQKCVGTGQCYDLYSYTMVYDLQTTIDVSVICNPSTPADFRRYTQGVMKAALQGMVEERNLSSHSTEFREEDKVRSASLTGTGITGAQDKIYTGQLWIGQNSVFTVQAELIGSAHAEADKTFSDILKSIQPKDGKQLPKKKSPVKKTN